MILCNHFHSCGKMSGAGDGSSVSSADLSRWDIRTLMNYDYYQGKSFEESFQSLDHYFGAQSASKATVFRWFRWFMSDMRAFKGDNRYGPIATTVTLENVSRAESLIEKPPKMAFTEIRDIMKISSESHTRVVHDWVGGRKCCARWAPHNRSEERKRGRVDRLPRRLRNFDGGRSTHVWHNVAGDEMGM